MVVFTKMTPNGKMTLYMPQRQFQNILSSTEPIDGVIVVDRSYVKEGRPIAVQLMSFLRYGREDDEVMGLRLFREMCLASQVVNRTHPLDRLTPMQEELKRIHGDASFPFHFEWPANLTSNLYIQLPKDRTDEPCGVKYYLEVFGMNGEGPQEVHKRSSLRFLVDVVQTSPANGPSSLWVPSNLSVGRPLLFPAGCVEVEANVDKNCIANGESLVVYISILNRSCYTIKEMKTTLTQLYKISFIRGCRKIPIKCITSNAGFPLAPGATLNTTVALTACPPANARELEDVALRQISRRLKVPQLASSTILPPDTGAEELFGILVSYLVRVKLSVAHFPMKSVTVAQVPICIVNNQKSAVKRSSKEF